MEPNHFSHNHGLLFHHLPLGSQVHCSGCKFPASGDVYTCRQCNFFLHQQCFHAPRSLNHPSHPLHPLTLMPSPTYPSSLFNCDSCNLVGHGLSYTCSQCEFDLHIHCSNAAPSLPSAAAGEEKVGLLGMMRQKAEEKRADEANAKKMEMEEELRRRRHNLTMQRLQQASDSIDFMGRIGSTPRPKLFDRYTYNF